jgi:hypothetical protein
MGMRERKRTGLDAGAVLLVGKELAQLSLVLVIKLLNVGLVNVEVGGRHAGQLGSRRLWMLTVVDREMV